MKASRIFVSYRRQDSPGFAGRIADHLERHFGRDAVFRDVETIEYGSDFVEAIDSALISCAALVVVIGPAWVQITDAHGQGRLHSADDFVRLEVAKALSRGVRVIPVLVQGAKAPTPGELPPELQALARRQAISVNDDRFADDMLRLIRALEPEMSSLTPGTRSVRAPSLPPFGAAASRWPKLVGIAIGALALGTTGLVFFQLGGARGSEATSRSAVHGLPVGGSGTASGAPSPAPHNTGGKESTASSSKHDAGSPQPRPLPRAVAGSIAPRKVKRVLPPAPPTGTKATTATSAVVAKPTVPAWRPLRMSGSVFGSIFNGPTRERRAAMLQNGPPYRSVRATERAWREQVISQQMRDDTLWVLAQWRARERREAESQYKAGLLTKPQLADRMASIEAAYQGR